MKKLLTVWFLVCFQLSCAKNDAATKKPADVPAPPQNIVQPEGNPNKTPLIVDERLEQKESPPSQVVDPLSVYQQQIGFQRRVVLEEQKALDQAYNDRSNRVHIGKDLRDLLAYGVSTGFLSYRFLNKTNNLQAVRDFLTKKNIQSDLQPTTGTTAVESESQSLEEAAAALSDVKRAATMRAIGSGLMRTAELTGAVVLGAFLLGDVVDTGNDLYVMVHDSDEIRAHKDKLKTAQKNLEDADRNLQTAILTQNSP